MPSPNITLRVPEPLLETLDNAAVHQVRSRTGQILRYVQEGLRRDGYLPRSGSPAPANEEPLAAK